MKRESWFKKLVKFALSGAMVASGGSHKLSPISQGNGWVTEKCPKCGRSGGVVLRSHTNGNVYIVACMVCKKYTQIQKSTGTSRNSSRCIAVTKAGTQCKNKAKANGYCSVHGG